MLVETAIGGLDDVAYVDFSTQLPSRVVLLRHGALLVQHLVLLASAGFALVEPLCPKAITDMNGTSTTSGFQGSFMHVPEYRLRSAVQCIWETLQGWSTIASQSKKMSSSEWSVY